MFNHKICIFAVLICLLMIMGVNAVEDSSKHVELEVNNHTFDIDLENNEATADLVEKLKKEDVKIEAREYGGFEKVGELGFSLPADDEYIPTSAGDIVLYQKNQVSLFYANHSWSYTKLGTLKNVTAGELKDILGAGNVTLTFSLK